MTDTLAQLQRSAVNALNKGDYRTLHQTCLKILSLNERHADAWFFLSIVASVQNQVKKAIDLVDRALAITPSQSEYLSQKAKYHSFLKQDTDALEAADNAAKMKPSNALTLDTLGVVYTNLGMFEKAKEHLAAAVEKQPTNPQYHFNLATTEQFLGNASAAKEHFETAIELQPMFARAYWSLSELEKDKLDGTRTSTLEALMTSQKLRPEDELYIAHALSREYEQVGEYEKAFKTLSKGKARRASQINYSSEDDKHIFESMQKAFSDRSIMDGAPSSLGEGVIFVVGMPRSGTTLIERILSSHSEVTSLGELQNLGIAVRKSVESNVPKTLDESIIEQAITADPQAIGKHYLDSLSERIPTTRYFIDKMPLNFLYIGFIKKCLPGAKIICLRRNPLDTCLSNYRQLFAINFSYYNYHYDIGHTARYFSYFHKLMAFWKDTFPENVYDVYYDDLTQHPEENIRDLLNHIGLDWEPECLAFHKNTSAVSTPSATQVRERLYTKAVGRWQKYENELKSVMEYLDSQGIDYR